MTKNHHVEQDLDRHCSSTQLRLHPALRCICGRTLKGYDASISDNGEQIRIVCQRCHTLLLAIERA
jgi:hypothetical protein